MSLNERCGEHGALLASGKCPYPTCSLGTEAAMLRANIGPASFYFVRRQAGEGYVWKMLRSKGRCSPCEQARRQRAAMRARPGS